jgi:hypothetical protein
MGKHLKLGLSETHCTVLPYLPVRREFFSNILFEEHWGDQGPGNRRLWAGVTTHLGKYGIVGDFRFSQQFCWELVSSGMWHCAVGWGVSEILKEHSAFIFKSLAGEENSWRFVQDIGNHSASDIASYRRTQLASFGTATEMCLYRYWRWWLGF